MFGQFWLGIWLVCLLDHKNISEVCSSQRNCLQYLRICTDSLLSSTTVTDRMRSSNRNWKPVDSPLLYPGSCYSWYQLLNILQLYLSFHVHSIAFLWNLGYFYCLFFLLLLQLGKQNRFHQCLMLFLCGYFLQFFCFWGTSGARLPIWWRFFFADFVTCANFSNLCGKFLKTHNRYGHHVFAKSCAGSWATFSSKKNFEKNSASWFF